MEYYIETGLSGRKRYKLHEITPYNLPNLKNQPLNKDWIPFAIKIMDDLAVDFNSYKFFCDVLKNTPPRFRFFALNETVLDLCKLLDKEETINLGRVSDKGCPSLISAPQFGQNLLISPIAIPQCLQNKNTILPSPFREFTFKYLNHPISLRNIHTLYFSHCLMPHRPNHNCAS